MTLEIGDVVSHRIRSTQKWGFGVIKGYRRYHGIYVVLWSDGQERTHTIELLKRIA